MLEEEIVDQEPNWEALLEQVIGAAQQEGQPGLLRLAAGSVPAREEQILAALPGIIMRLRGQGVAEEELFATAVAASARELAGGG
jgi:hypothetical protein